MAARGSDLPGVTTAKMIEQLTESHSYTGIKRFAEPRGVHVRRCLGTTTQRMREPAPMHDSGGGVGGGGGGM